MSIVLTAERNAGAHLGDSCVHEGSSREHKSQEPLEESEELADPFPSPRYRKRSYNLPIDVAKRFDAVAIELGFTTDAEVLRHALKIFFYLHDRCKSGDKVVIESPTGATREVLNPAL